MTFDWRETLPFMGRDAVIERMAVIDHESSNDPLAQLVTGRQGMSWLEIFNTGHSALRQIGGEIANAATEADAATADLRRTTIMEGLVRAEANMLQVAQRMLAKGIIAFDPDHMAGLVAYGRFEVGGTLQLIPPAHWPAGHVDWHASRLTVEGGKVWFDVRSVDISTLETDALLKVMGDAGLSGGVDQSPFGRRRKLGRPGEIDWHGADIAADQYIQENGLPEQQARIVELIMDWLRDNDAGRPPNRRTVEKHVAKTFYGDAA